MAATSPCLPLEVSPAKPKRSSSDSDSPVKRFRSKYHRDISCDLAGCCPPPRPGSLACVAAKTVSTRPPAVRSNLYPCHSNGLCRLSWLFSRIQPAINIGRIDRSRAGKSSGTRMQGHVEFSGEPCRLDLFRVSTFPRFRVSTFPRCAPHYADKHSRSTD